MRLIKPFTITEGMLTSNVPEDDYDPWTTTDIYGVGDRVIYEHRIYESASSGNVGQTPSSTSTSWIDVGPTNRWAMFDEVHTTRTIYDAPISVEIVPNEATTAIALLNLACRSVRIRIMDGTSTVYDETFDMSGSLIGSNWWEYFFGAWIPQTTLLVLELPSYYYGTVLIDIQDSGGSPPTPVSCGVCILGQLRTFSEYDVALGARVGIQDYSRKERNDYGDLILVERAYAKRATMQALLPNILLPVVYETLAEVRATPVVWIGSEEIDPLIIYGFYKTADILIAYPEQSLLEIELEGLT